MTATTDAPVTPTLAKLIQADPPLEINLDLQAKEVRYADIIVPVDIAASAHEALVSGQWDFLSQLLDNKDAIRQTASRLPYMNASV